jgi:hypothetical protein
LRTVASRRSSMVAWPMTCAAASSGPHYAARSPAHRHWPALVIREALRVPSGDDLEIGGRRCIQALGDECDSGLSFRGEGDVYSRGRRRRWPRHVGGVRLRRGIGQRHGIAVYCSSMRWLGGACTHVQ